MTSSEEPTLYMYSTTVSDVGTVRSNNQDSSFAGAHLVAICDGMGGHAGGDTASTIAIRSLAHIEQDSPNGDVARATQIMEASAMAAHDAIVGKAKRERKLAGMGTTITAITLVADYWVLAHIGDSRAYLLRDGHLMRLTSDHSYVQHLIDTKRISQSEARNHPQRNVVMRVLGDFDIDARPDISIRTARAGDRLLLCSDGLCGVLEDSTIEETMLHFTDPEECAQKLVSMALRAGSTDNVSAVIADATLALNADGFDLPHQTPIVGGAASATLEAVADIIHEPVVSAPPLISTSSPAERAAALIASRKPGGRTVLAIFLLWLASIVALSVTAIRGNVGDRLRRSHDTTERLLNTPVVIDSDTTTLEELLHDFDEDTSIVDTDGESLHISVPSRSIDITIDKKAGRLNVTTNEVEAAIAAAQ